MKNKLFIIILISIVALGIILRLKGLISNPSLWHDECALGYNIVTKSYQELFEKLRFLQIAPPLFLVISKFFVNLFHVQDKLFGCDFVLRIFPFLCGTASLWLFYLICKKLFNFNYAILFAMSIFSFNPALINYCFELKQYSTDMLCVLITVWIFLNINFKTDSVKKIYLYGISLAIIMWFSFISTIAMAGGILTLSFKKENPKLFSSLLMPVILSGFLYMKIFIANIYAQTSSGMIRFWQNEFVKKDLSNLSQLISDNMNYFFSNLPYLSEFFIVILMIIGFILFIKDNKLRFPAICTLTLSVLIVVSIMHFYPFSRRLILFLIPLILIFVAKTVDIKNKFLSSVIILIILVPHLIFGYNFLKIKNLNRGDFARELMTEMVREIKPQEKIFINNASNVEYHYYNLFFKLKNEIIIADTIKNLPKGSYKFYMPYDYKTNSSAIKKIKSEIEQSGTIVSDIHATGAESTLLHVIIH